MNIYEAPKNAHSGGASHKIKSGWRAEEQKEKIKSRFAGAKENPKIKQSKGPVVTSRPQPFDIKGSVRRCPLRNLTLIPSSLRTLQELCHSGLLATLTTAS